MSLSRSLREHISFTSSRGSAGALFGCRSLPTLFVFLRRCLGIWRVLGIGIGIFEVFVNVVLFSVDLFLGWSLDRSPACKLSTRLLTASWVPGPVDNPAYQSAARFRGRCGRGPFPAASVVVACVVLCWTGGNPVPRILHGLLWDSLAVAWIPCGWMTRLVLGVFLSGRCDRRYLAGLGVLVGLQG